MEKKELLIYAFILLIFFFTFTLLVFKPIHSFLTFSDSAKYADIAKNLVERNGYRTGFTFFGPGVFDSLKYSLFSAQSILPAMPFSIVIFFKFFGVNDFSVIAVSLFFYIILVLFTFLLGKRLFSTLVGVLVVVTIGININILDYATSGASEVLLMAEIVAATYFLTLRRKWATLFGFLLLSISYFTRPHAFIFISALILYWLLLNFNTKRALLYFLGVIAACFLIDRFILLPLSGKYFLYSITGRGLKVTNTYVSGVAVSDALRGGVSANASLVEIGKKVLFNLYNFYKLLPNIISSYLFTFFILGILIKDNKQEVQSLKISTIFMLTITFLVVALTIPFFRYIHPVIPLVYLFAINTLVWIVMKIAEELKGNGYKINKKRFVAIVSTVLVTIFVVGQSLGVLLLDSRFEASRLNRGEAPVYVQLSWKLKEQTSPDDVIITNLDTWGSWYGERKTIWFPLEPDMLIPPKGGENPFDAIYLTDYLIDDENYYMGEEWRQMLNNPEDIENEYISENYELKGVYNVPADDTYENQVGKAILLVRKPHSE